MSKKRKRKYGRSGHVQPQRSQYGSKRKVFRRGKSSRTPKVPQHESQRSRSFSPESVKEFSWLEKSVTALFEKVVEWSIWGKISTAIYWDKWPEFVKSPMVWLWVVVLIVPFILTYIFHENTSFNWWWSGGVVGTVYTYVVFRYVTNFTPMFWKVVHVLGIVVGGFLLLRLKWNWPLPLAFFADSLLLGGLYYIVLHPATIAPEAKVKGRIVFNANPYKVNFFVACVERWFKPDPVTGEKGSLSKVLEYFYATDYFADDVGVHYVLTEAASWIPGGGETSKITYIWRGIATAEVRSVGWIINWPNIGRVWIVPEGNKPPIYWLVRKPRLVQDLMLEQISGRVRQG